MSNDGRDTLPTLREETRAAQGRALELLASAVVISTLLSLAINLGSSLIANTFATPIQIGLIVASTLLGLLAIVILLPRISTTVKEFEEDIEILVPLMVSPNDISVLRVRHYDELTELAHAAVSHMTAEQRQQLAHLLLAHHGDADSDERRKLTAFLLELTQFLMVAQLVRESRTLLGAHAAYHKLRTVARQQSAVTAVEWQALAAQADSNAFLHHRTQGIPEKILLPEGVTLALPAVAPVVLGKVRRQRMASPGIPYIPLMEAHSHRDTALRISAMVGFSEHGLPPLNAPHRGFTARCILRNARDQRIHELAAAEEQSASAFRAATRARKAATTDDAEVAATYAAAHAKLYDGGNKPFLMRVFVRFDGVFRIRLLSGDRKLRGQYAWGAALSRLLAESDIVVFLATLREAGQKIPRRSF
ncbi:MAG: hypothetical protein ACM3N4_00250 [Nitrososphaerota archaeon]